MPKNLNTIQFSLNEKQRETLSSLAIEGESIGLTAKRLLLAVIEGNQDNIPLSSPSLSESQIRQLIREDINERMPSINEAIKGMGEITANSPLFSEKEVMERLESLIDEQFNQMRRELEEKQDNQAQKDFERLNKLLSDNLDRWTLRIGKRIDLIEGRIRESFPIPPDEGEPNLTNGEGDQLVPTLIPPDTWLDGNGIRIKLNQDIPYSPKDWKKDNIVLFNTFNPFKKLFSSTFCMVDTDVSVRASIDQVDEIYVDWSFKLHNQDYPENYPDYPDYLRDLGIPIFNWDREKVLGEFDPDALYDPSKPNPVTEPNSANGETVTKIIVDIPTEPNSSELDPILSLTSEKMLKLIRKMKKDLKIKNPEKFKEIDTRIKAINSLKGVKSSILADANSLNREERLEILSEFRAFITDSLLNSLE